MKRLALYLLGVVTGAVATVAAALLADEYDRRWARWEARRR